MKLSIPLFLFCLSATAIARKIAPPSWAAPVTVKGEVYDNRTLTIN